jgi:hypothetical protein
VSCGNDAVVETEIESRLYGYYRYSSLRELRSQQMRNDSILCVKSRRERFVFEKTRGTAVVRWV